MGGIICSYLYISIVFLLIATMISPILRVVAIMLAVVVIIIIVVAVSFSHLIVRAPFLKPSIVFY